MSISCFTFQAKDGSLLYGVCQTLVNLTNTFDKPDIPDEMKELGEFAKVKLPKFHEKVPLRSNFRFSRINFVTIFVSCVLQRCAFLLGWRRVCEKED